ncbi:MAG: hypothetical protein FWB75_07190, partial [Oscillospiraceae bacterium]|nr:hypothetical protein [Oscillospiraceae bacterium]
MKKLLARTCALLLSTLLLSSTLDNALANTALQADFDVLGITQSDFRMVSVLNQEAQGELNNCACGNYCVDGTAFNVRDVVTVANESQLRTAIAGASGSGFDRTNLRRIIIGANFERTRSSDMHTLSGTTNVFATARHVQIVAAEGSTITITGQGGSGSTGLNQRLFTVRSGSTVIFGGWGGNLILDNIPQGDRASVSNTNAGNGTSGGLQVVDANTLLELRCGTTITGGDVHWGGGVHVESGATFRMWGGEITENLARNASAAHTNPTIYGGGVHINGLNSLFEMRGGRIHNNEVLRTGGTFDAFGGGVSVVNQGNFAMHSGVIENNTLIPTGVGRGGGVYIQGNSSFSMYGGTIRNHGISNPNQNSNHTVIGGGVHVTGGSASVAANFTMHGGTITNNRVTAGGGVVVDSGGVFIMNNGGVIDDNSATETGGGVLVAGGLRTGTAQGALGDF